MPEVILLGFAIAMFIAMLKNRGDQVPVWWERREGENGAASVLIVDKRQRGRHCTVEESGGSRWGEALSSMIYHL